MKTKFQRTLIIFAFFITIDVFLLGTLGGMLKAKTENTKMASANDVEAPLAGELPFLAALTFDDGPDPVYTEMLLDGLLERGVKATFFVIGRNIVGNEDLIKRMYDEGHIIGNHTYHHVVLSNYTLIAACQEIEATNQLLYEITGEIPKYIRPPFGATAAELECMIDMTTVMWDIDPRDWQNKNKDKIVRHVVKNIEDNKIILLHDVYKPSVEAALEIIDQMQADGWKFVTIEDLMPD